MSQPTPRSSFMQTLLIAAVIFLGLNLFMQKPTPPNPTALEATYSASLKSYTDAKAEVERLSAEPNADTAKLAAAKVALTKASEEYVKAIPPKAHELRKDPKTASEARALELQAAEINLSLAVEANSFDKGLAAWNEFHRLHAENATDEVGAKTATLMPEAAAKTDAIARKVEGFTSYGYKLVDWLVNLFGKDKAPGLSYWLAAVVLAIIVRGLVWPLSHKQMLGFKRMAQLQPMIKELQQKYQGPELNQRVMKVYQKYGINPLAGCWPMLIQMPFFLWVFYSMRLYQFEFHKGTFLWISQAGANAMPGIVAPNLGERDVILVLIYGASMVASTLLAVTDPQSARQQRIMGIGLGLLFTVMMLFWTFPSAFVLYWIVLNTVSTIQSVRMSKLQLPPLQEVPEHLQKGAFGGVMPKDGPKGNGNGTPLGSTKTGAPVVHKPKGGKGKRR